MPVLNPDFAVSVPFTRLTEDSFGGSTPTDLGATPVVVSIAAAATAKDSGERQGPGYTQAGTVFTPRGLDRKAGDRFTYNGATYVLIGLPRGNQPQPFTGDDFGWISHSIERVP